MDTYSLLREIADSWVMLGIFSFFICASVWAFLPSQTKAREDASMIPFRNEKKPAKASTEKGTDGQSTPSSSDLKGA